MGGVKDVLMSLFIANPTKDFIKPKHAKNMYGRENKPSKLKIQKQSEENKLIKNIRNRFRQKLENEEIKDRILKDIGTLSEQEENHYKPPVGVGNFWSSDYIKYESNGNRKKNLSIEESVDKINPYLSQDIVNGLQKRDTWKIQLTIAINFKDR